MSIRAPGFDFNTDISQIRGQSDVIGQLLRSSNDVIGNAAITGQFSEDFPISIQYVTTLGNAGLDRYIKGGSFYPALIPAMQMGEYTKILNVFAAFSEEQFSKVQTPQLRLCYSACLLQANMQNECLSALGKCKTFGDLDILIDLINNSEAGERKAYQDLKSVAERYYSAPPIDFQMANLNRESALSIDFQLANLNLRG